MRRSTLIALALILLLGATTSIALAWLRAALSDPAIGENRFITNHGSERGTHDRFAIIQFNSTAQTARLLAPPDAWGVNTDPTPIDVPPWSQARKGLPPRVTRSHSAVEKDLGWPRKCMRAVWKFEDDSLLYQGENLKGGILIDPVDWGQEHWLLSAQPDFNYVEAESHRALPLIPIWRGLLINTLVFAAPWLALTAPLPLLGAVRRHRRRRKGRCTACRYPRPEQSDRCPECGRPYSRRTPLIGRYTLLTLIALNATTIAATLTFGAWRASSAPRMPDLHKAAALGDIPTIKRLIDEGADPNTPLDWATPVPGYLLSQGTPLAWAAARGHPDAVQVLLDAGADPNHVRSASSPRPLRLAARFAHADICKALIDAGATQVAQPTPMETTALSSAVSSADWPTIETVLQATTGPITDPNALASALPHPPDLLTRLIDTRRFSSSAIDGALRVAVAQARPEHTRLLIDAGADPAKSEHPLLWLAADAKSPELITLLLDRGADITKEHSVSSGWTPLRRATVHACIDCFNILLDAGADPTSPPDLLHCAVRFEQRPEIIARLIAEGLDVNARNGAGKTPLMEAVRGGELFAVKQLLDAGADPTIKDTDGNTALDYARGGIDYRNDMWISADISPAPTEITTLLEQLTPN